MAYYFNQAYYLLYKAEGKYKEALHYKEICSDMLDSLTLVQNETKVLEIEKKYNNAKIQGRERTIKDYTAKEYNHHHYCHLLILTISCRIYHLPAEKQSQNLLPANNSR